MALDNFRKTSMRIDKANQRFLDYQNAKAGDVNGRELLVQITNNGVVEDQTGTTLKLNWQHENGNQGYTNFNAVDIKAGKYSLYYPSEMLYKGTVDASIEINSNGQTTNTMNFKIIVHADVFNGEAGTVNGVFISLADVNKKLDDREKEYVELKERQTNVETQFNSIQQELTDTDIDSAPEIIAARGGEPTLNDRLDKDQQKVNTRFEENPNPSIGKGPKDTRPVITFVTDDARRQDITIFKDMFQRVGLPVSTAVTPYRSINTPDYGNVYLTVDEIRTLQDEFGWEIVSHTWNHERLTEISDEALDFTLKESRDWLRDNGFKGYEYLMYPFGLYDERVKRFTAKYYRAARTTAGLWGSVTNEFPVASYQLSTRFFSQTVSLDILKADVDRLIERGGWLNIFFHSWEIDDWSREADFEEMLNYVKSKQDSGLLDVMGYKDTYEKYGNIIDQASYVDKNDDMFIVQQNGNVRTNFGKTKKIANNSLNNSSLPNEFPIDYTSYMTSTRSENGFPTASGTLETIYFNPNPNEPTNTRYCRQTYYPYNSSLVYTRGYLASGWTAWSTPGSGTSTPTESQFAIITGSSVDGNTPPSEFPASNLTLYSKGTNTPGMPTTIGGILTVYKVGTDYSFWYQEYKASGGNRKWRRYATSGNTWSAWQLIVADYGGTRPTNVAPGFMFFDATIGKPVWLKSEGVWVDATGTTV